MKIATARTKTSKRWKTIDISWEEFLDRLRVPMRTAETVREFKAMGKTERDQAKEAAGGFVGGALNGGQRKTEFVRERWLITLDADNAKPGAWERAKLLLDFRMAVYSTHSHTAEKPRLRWIIPVDRAMTPDEYPAVSRMVASWLDIETMDLTTFELARLFFFPTCAKDGEYEFHEQDGPVLRVDEVLARYGDGDAWKDATLWPIAKLENEIRVRPGRKVEDPETKGGIVGLFCNAYDIHSAIEEHIPEVYTPCSYPDRYTYAGGSTHAGAVVYDDDKLLYSNHATDPCQGRSVNSFDLVRIHKFGHLDANAKEGTPVTKLPSYMAMCDWAVKLDVIAAAQVEAQREQATLDFADMVVNAAADGIGEEVAAGDPKWRTKIRRGKNSEVEESIENAKLYLRNLPELKGKIGYNSMSDSITVTGDLPWRPKKRRSKAEERFDALRNSRGPNKRSNSGTAEMGAGLDTGKGRLSYWTDSDWSGFYNYMENFGFTTKGKNNGTLDNALQIVSQDNSFHPVRSYLCDLEWDGVERLDTMFIRWLGAEDDLLTRTITRLWMVAAVDRIMRPGCQFDSVLVACGKQGQGKSRMLRKLSKGFFTNSIDKLNVCKETSEKLQGVWLVELGELDGMRKGALTAIKNFVTSTEDRYRSAYAREAKSHKRQCVFFGSSNELSFLRDATGERRFWIMPVSGTGDNGEMVGFVDEVDQLWAEAYSDWLQRMVDAGAESLSDERVELKLYLKDPKLIRQMELRQSAYKMPEEDRDDVAGYLDTGRPTNWYEMDIGARRDFAQGLWVGDKGKCTLQIDSITVKELRCELFGERPEDTGSGKDRSLRLARIMDTMPGWRKAGKKRIPGYGMGPQQMWERIKKTDDSENKEEK